MQTICQLGRSGLQVSRLALGTVNFGWQCDESDAVRLMERAQERGLNLFDTANTYGGPGRKGETERIIGRWFAQGGGRRERTVLATKVYGSFSDWPNDGKLSALNIRRSCDASLARLGTDYIDLYQLHFVDPDTPWDEIWSAMEVLHAQGKVLYFGSSNFKGWQIAAAHGAAGVRGLRLTSHQSEYNLLNRTVEDEVLPACAAHGIGFLAYSPLQHGVLAGGSGERRATPKASAVVQCFTEQLEVFEVLCQKAGLEPAKVALAWLLARPKVTAVIVGPRTLEQLDAALDALEVELSPALLARLDELFPGPHVSINVGDAAVAARRTRPAMTRS
jgi:aryl-alcohol dehydrogenase-like predicted oxidoreductase